MPTITNFGGGGSSNPYDGYTFTGTLAAHSDTSRSGSVSSQITLPVPGINKVTLSLHWYVVTDDYGRVAVYGIKNGTSTQLYQYAPGNNYSYNAYLFQNMEFDISDYDEFRITVWSGGYHDAYGNSKATYTFTFE